MDEAAKIIGLFSAALLIVAVVAWVRLGWGPALQRTDGRMASTSGETEFASQLLVLAFGLSAIAAILAVIGWIGL